MQGTCTIVNFVMSEFVSVLVQGSNISLWCQAHITKSIL